MRKELHRCHPVSQLVSELRRSCDEAATQTQTSSEECSRRTSARLCVPSSQGLHVLRCLTLPSVDDGRQCSTRHRPQQRVARRPQRGNLFTLNQAIALELGGLRAIAAIRLFSVMRLESPAAPITTAQHHDVASAKHSGAAVEAAALAACICNPEGRVDTPAAVWVVALVSPRRSKLSRAQPRGLPPPAAPPHAPAAGVPQRHLQRSPPRQRPTHGPKRLQHLGTA